MLTDVEDVRTFKKSRVTKKAAQDFLREMSASIAHEPRIDRIVENITKLEQMFDQEQMEYRKAA